MSDSFADLWSSSAPIPPKQKPQTLSSASSSRSNLTSSTANSGSKPDVFALLSSSGTSTPAARYGNGSSYTTTSSSSSSTFNRTTPRPSNPPSRTMTPSMSTGTRSDAFSDLFAPSTATTTSNMTLAARLAMEAEQRASRTSPGMQNTPSSGAHQANDAAWAGLDSLGGGIPSIPAVSVSKPNVLSGRAPKVDEEDDWGLGDFGKPTSADASIAPIPAARQPKPRTQTTAQSIAQAAQAAEKKKGVSLWDMEEFSGAHTSSAQQTTQHQRPSTSQREPAFETLFDGNDGDHVDSPDVDFDFGSREDQEASNKPRHRHKGGLLDFEDDGDHDSGRGSGMDRGLLDDGDQGGHGSGRGRGREQDGDDILGMLGRPVQDVRTQRERESESTSTTRTRNTHDDTNKPSRTGSPPPHILGQIVEMGFSISQAKQALAATTDGQDVQAALETLLNGSGDTAERPSQRERHPQSQHTSPPTAPPVPTRPRGAPKGQKERERERLERQRQQQQQQQAGEGGFADMQEQADRLLAQASEIGSSVFSKASAFWKEGKEKVVKAYEERTTGERALPGRGSASGQGVGGVGGNVGGRPKWMQEVVHPSDDEDTYERETSAFKDEYDQGPSISSHHDPVSSQQQQLRKAELEIHDQEIDLFAVDHELQTQRHRNPSPQPRAHPIRHASSSSSVRSSPGQSQSSTSRVAPPIPVPTRNFVTASPSALSLAQKHKTAGTDQFKLGQHGPAAESYSSAISALPTGHLLLVPLYTNRALTRLRTGEYTGAIEDCERAVEGIVGKRIFSNDTNTTSSSSASYGIEDPLAHTSKSSKSTVIPPPLLDASSIPASLIAAGRSRANGGGWTHPQGIGVDVLDSYTKALRRAAEAFEGREKWVEACAWWGVLSRAGEGDSAGWVDDKARKEAIAGGVRCRKMVDGNGNSAGSGSQEGISSVARPTPTTSRPKANLKTSRPAPSSIPKSTAPSKALQALQSTNAQAEADDNAKYALKDTVDARLLAWKGGKETNVRALLASLETVLWEGPSGIQGLKMGMADLVSAGQVKKGYVKAISRVHPDKLNAGNSTLEQRMLANGIFAGLNEAWIAFQGTQK